MVDKHLEENLRKLEESLWVAETRYDKDYMENILAPDFFEFGRSGKTYTREEIITAQGHEIDAKLRDFKVTMVREDVYLVTYVSEVKGADRLEVGNRSSLWVRDENKWLLKFHQGSQVDK